MSQETKRKKRDDSVGALFIPAGVLTGMGLGFLFNHVPAGIFIGLGVGFFAFAITELVTRSKRNNTKEQ